MDRYKFEDSISAYIDNELTLTERQEFEDYIEKNPDAKSLLFRLRHGHPRFRRRPAVVRSALGRRADSRTVGHHRDSQRCPTRTKRAVVQTAQGNHGLHGGRHKTGVFIV